MKTGTKVKLSLTVVFLLFLNKVSSFDTHCSDGKLKCDRNKCIPARWICDGTPDCDDETDEMKENCPGVSREQQECKSSQFTCKVGHCIPLNWKCDGVADCENKSDEHPENCEHVCTDLDYRCQDGQCIDIKWRCDGRTDCNDQSDETNCTTPSTTDPDRFTCGDSYSIPRKWLCDGMSDCNDGSDEQNCESDEASTTPYSVSGCLDFEFQCPGSFCINKKWLCNGLKDCLNGEDEENCPTRQCKLNEFRCADGPCMRLWYKCNGENDCKDGSDETDCVQKVKTRYTTSTTTVLPPSTNQVKTMYTISSTTVEPSSTKNMKSSFTTVLPTATDHPTMGVTTDKIPATTEEICDLDTHYQCADSKCISRKKLCDGFDDCGDKHDESVEQCGKDECKENNGGCVHTCVDTREGYYCICDEGYKIVGKYNCEDINECQEVPGICSQSCTNIVGGFHCSCITGYMKDPANYTRCKVTVGDVLLLFSHSFDIRQLRLRDQEMRSVIGDTRNAIALDYSFVDGDIFWSEKRERKILRANIHRTMEREVLLSQQDVSADGLAVDWIHRTIYFTDNTKCTVNLASWDGKWVKTIINENMTHPRAIVVSPLQGYIYWTDWGRDPKIERAGLDGSDRFALITNPQYVRWPNGLVIDHPTKRLYWCDGLLKSIFSSDLDGKRVEVVLYSTDFLNHAFSISVFEDRLYWTDWSKVALFSADKFTGSEIQSVSAGHMLEAPRVVHVYHQFRQPTGENVCAEHTCEHFCIRSVEGIAFCTCADGYVAARNPSKCIKEEEIQAEGAIINDVSSAPSPSIEQSQTSPLRCYQNSQSLELLDVEIIESQSLCESPSNIGGILGGSLAALVCVGFLIAAVFIWSRNSNRTQQFKRIFFPNPIYVRTTEEYPDGRGLIINQDRMLYKPMEETYCEQPMTDADDAPLTPKTDYGMV